MVKERNVKIKYMNQILFGVYIKRDAYLNESGFSDIIKLDKAVFIGNLTTSMGLMQNTVSVDDVEIIEWL